MFDFERGDDLDLVVETARSFASAELVPKLRDHESARGVGPAVRAAYREIGLAGLELPERLGGAGLGALARVLVNEELAAGDAGAALALDPLGAALYPLLELGGEAAVEELAIPLLDADGARAVLVDERDARLEIGATVSGKVPWVPADRVDLVVVLREDGALAIRGGIALEPLRGSGLRAAGASELRLDRAAPVARWSDARAASRARARARLHAASLLVGVARQAAEFSREYALERRAFGRPIAHHQALAFLITDMRAAVDSARLLVHEAAWRVDAGLACGAAAAAAYAEAIEAGAFVGPNGVQILGGHGFMQDYPVEKYMREIRALSVSLGGLDLAREEAGQALCAVSGRVALSSFEGLEGLDGLEGVEGVEGARGEGA
jgi:alkylation response protein AidB-like acyl-CoA dehydrogenase